MHKDSAQLAPVSRSLRSLPRTTQHHPICEIRTLSDAQNATSTMTTNTALSCHRNPPPTDVAPGRKCSKMLPAQHSIPVNVRTAFLRERRADFCDFDGSTLLDFHEIDNFTNVPLTAPFLSAESRPPPLCS